MENNLSDRLFQQFSQLVYEQCGINLHEGKKALLQARLNKRLRLTGIDSYEEYFKFITSAGKSRRIRPFSRFHFDKSYLFFSRVPAF